MPNPGTLAHKEGCMYWQVSAAADRGDGFPEPEDVCCTCGVAEEIVTIDRNGQRTRYAIKGTGKEAIGAITSRDFIRRFLKKEEESEE